MRTILLPTDFSETAWNAISYAFRLFQGDQCRMVLLHAYSPAFYRLDYAFGGPEVSAIADPDTERVLRLLEELELHIRGEFPEMAHEIVIHSGFNTLPEELNTVAQQRDVDLVIMGTQGIRGWKDRIFGSSTTGVIRHCHIPLLVVPEGFSYCPPRKVVLATDLATEYRTGDMDPLLWICGEKVDALTVLHLTEDLALTAEQLQCKEELLALLQDIPYRYEEIRSGLMPDGLLEHLTKISPDLAVITRHSHSFWEKTLLEQQSEAISAAIDIPLLILPESN